MTILINKKNISITLFFFFALSIFLINASFSSAQNIEGPTEKTIEVNIYKKDKVYEVQLLTIKKLAYPYLADNKLLINKIHYGKVISFQGKALGFFTAKEMTITKCWDEFAKDGSITGGCEDVPEGEILLRIPYFNNGAKAEIYDLNNQKILTIDLSAKAVCNENNMCNVPIENSINCASDCRNGEPIISDYKTLQNQELESFTNMPYEKYEENSAERPWWNDKTIILAIIFFVAFILFL